MLLIATIDVGVTTAESYGDNATFVSGWGCGDLRMGVTQEHCSVLTGNALHAWWKEKV